MFIVFFGGRKTENGKRFWVHAIPVTRSPSSVKLTIGEKSYGADK